jgi:MFS superfamily sulfate permease-like transporter
LIHRFHPRLRHYMNATPQNAAPAPFWTRWFPAFGWLRSYQPAWFRGDIAAGVTLAAYLLPAGIGDASLANLPPQAGLYACLFSGLLFWLFCSSRHTAISVTSAISLLMGSSLGALAGGDPSRFGALAAGTALLVAALAFIAWLLKAGVIVKFISETVLIGFKAGVALYLASTHLPKLFGIHGSHGNFLATRTGYRSRSALAHWPFSFSVKNFCPTDPSPSSSWLAESSWHRSPTWAIMA